MLARFAHIEAIPPNCRDWHVNATAAPSLARTLNTNRDAALLFRTLATLRTDIDLFDDVEQLRWRGPSPRFHDIGVRLDAAVTEKSAKPGAKRASASQA